MIEALSQFASPPALGLLAAMVGHPLTRVWLLVRCRWVGSDTYYHFMVGELLRRAGRLPLRNHRFLLVETVDYPPVVPFVVASWPPSRIRLLQYAGPAADFGTLVVVGVTAFWLGGLSAASLAALAYASTPASFDMGYSFNPRPVANLFLAVVLASLIAVSHVGPLALAVAIVFGSLVLLTHRLTTQSLVVCAFAYFVFAPLPSAATIFLSLLVAALLSKGYYVRSLRGHVAFIRDIRRLLPTRSNPATALLRTLRGNPHVLAVAFLVIQHPSQSRDTMVLIAWTGALLVTAAVWPFGEGDRHFANASSPVAILVSLGQWDGATGAVPALTIAVGLGIIAAKLAVYPRLAKRGTNTIVTAALRRACRSIRASWNRPTRPLVLTWPQSLSYQVMYFAQARGVLASGGTGSGLAFNRALETRLREGGLSALSRSEVPDFLICLDRAGMSDADTPWAKIFERDGVRVYQRGDAGGGEHGGPEEPVVAIEDGARQ